MPHTCNFLHSANNKNVLFNFEYFEHYLNFHAKLISATTGFPTRCYTNRPAQSQKKARSLKFWFRKKKNCTIRVVKTKVVCAFVFADANCWFSEAAAQILKKKSNEIFYFYVLSNLCILLGRVSMM